MQKTNPKYFESAHLLMTHIQDLLRRWNDSSGINTYVLSLDGLSGSGKSTISREISSTIRKMLGVSFYPMRVDTFIATARGSPLRAQMLESRRLFWKLIYDRQSMADVLTDIIGANGEKCTIPVSRHYNRADGTVAPAVLNIPKGRKILLVDGIDSTRIVRMVHKTETIPQTRIMVLTPPHVALKRAARRDAKQGRRSVHEATVLRKTEFQYLAPQICNHNINDVDVIYAPDGFHS